MVCAFFLQNAVAAVSILSFIQLHERRVFGRVDSRRRIYRTQRSEIFSFALVKSKFCTRAPAEAFVVGCKNGQFVVLARKGVLKNIFLHVFTQRKPLAQLFLEAENDHFVVLDLRGVQKVNEIVEGEPPILAVLHDEHAHNAMKLVLRGV